MGADLPTAKALWANLLDQVNLHIHALGPGLEFLDRKHLCSVCKNPSLSPITQDSRPQVQAILIHPHPVDNRFSNNWLMCSTMRVCEK